MSQLKNRVRRTFLNGGKKLKRKNNNTLRIKKFLWMQFSFILVSANVVLDKMFKYHMKWIENLFNTITMKITVALFYIYIYKKLYKKFKYIFYIIEKPHSLKTWEKCSFSHLSSRLQARILSS